MQSTDATRLEYEAMLKERRIGWGGRPTQPLERCVAHTLSMLVHTIEAACHRDDKGAYVASAANGELSQAELRAGILKYSRLSQAMVAVVTTLVKNKQWSPVQQKR